MKILMQKLLKLQTLEFGKARDDNTTSLIAELRTKIPAQILIHYDRLRARGKKGLAAAHNQVCTACHMRLPLAVIMTLKHGLDIQLCGSCGRYLYLPDETQSAPSVEPLATKPVRAPRKRKKTITTA